MKFLIISNLYEPYARGGAEGVVKTTVEALVNRGDEVIVLTAGPASSGLSPKETKQNGARVFRFFPLNIYFVHDDWRFPKFLRAFARLIDLWNFHSSRVVSRVIEEEKPDVIISHNLVGIGLNILRVIKQKKTKTIHILHDAALIYPSGLIFYGEEKKADASLFRKIYEYTTKKIVGSPDIVVSPSSWLLGLHTDRGFFPKSKCVVISNPVNCAVEEKNNLRKISPFRILYAGQLETHKGVLWLLEQITNSHPERSEGSLANAGSSNSHTRGILWLRPQNDIVIEFAGKGTLEREVRGATEKSSGQIIYHGVLNQESLQKLFLEVNALIVPSFCYENAPRIISEALSVGLPVIASRIGGIPEMVKDGENGFLFEPGNYDSFVAAVSKLKESHQKIRENIKLSGSLMTIDRYLDKIIKL